MKEEIREIDCFHGKMFQKSDRANIRTTNDFDSANRKETQRGYKQTKQKFRESGKFRETNFNNKSSMSTQQTKRKPKSWNSQIGGDWNEHNLVLRDFDNFENAILKEYSRDRIVMMKISGGIPAPVIILDTQKSFNINKKAAVITVLEPRSTLLVYKQDLMPLQIGISKHYPIINRKHVKLPHILNSLNEANRLYDEVMVENSEIDNFEYVANLKPKREKGNYSKTCSVCQRFFKTLSNLERHERTAHTFHDEDSYENMKTNLEKLKAVSLESIKNVRQRTCHEKAIKELELKIEKREKEGLTKRDKRDLGLLVSDTDTEEEVQAKPKKSIRRISRESDDDEDEIIPSKKRKRIAMIESSSDDEDENAEHAAKKPREEHEQVSGQDEFEIEGEPVFAEEPEIEEEEPFVETIKIEPNEDEQLEEVYNEKSDAPIERSLGEIFSRTNGYFEVRKVTAAGSSYVECVFCKMRFDTGEQLWKHMDEHRSLGDYEDYDMSAEENENDDSNDHTTEVNLPKSFTYAEDQNDSDEDVFKKYLQTQK